MVHSETASDAGLERDEPGHPAPTSSGLDDPAPGRTSSMLPKRRERSPIESVFVRLVATAGVVGIGVALGAILTSQNVAGWIIGLVVALVSVIVSAVLWSSRRM